MPKPSNEPDFVIGESPWEDALALIGKRVEVIMYHDDPDATIIGTLVSLDDEGDFVMDTDDGLRYCWPFVEARCV